MGCNAWNHPIDCNCGWGGDTGGGGGNRAALPYRSLRVVDGFTWRFDRKPSYDSFVNPNATCPVCGASVYFYQSPFGGRVFFDELGPPWPKHPCTDNAQSGISKPRGHDFIFGPASTPTKQTPPLLARNAWHPLLSDEVTRVGDFDRLRVEKRERLPGTFLYVPVGWIGDAPAFWRWHPDDPALVEISCMRLTVQGDLETQTFSVPNWLDDDQEFGHWLAEPNTALSPEALTSIGFSVSFAWRLYDSQYWYMGFPGVDFAVAKACFEQAAESDYWVALNNLGVMYRDGLGVTPDPAIAFELFQRAAQSLDPTPLRHLANCYRDGLGCDPDPEFQTFLEEMIVVREEERAAA